MTFKDRQRNELAYAGELACFVSIECLGSWKVMRIQNDTMDEYESHQKWITDPRRYSFPMPHTGGIFISLELQMH